MTELDFDELDKAVNSLMGDKAVPQPKSDNSDTADTDTSSAVAPVTPPTPEPDVVSAPVVLAAAPLVADTASAPKDESRSASLAVKRRGQFMDVMHPSADMKTTPRPVRPVTRVSRLGTTLAPSTSPASDSSATPNASPIASEAVSSTSTDTSVWPDPIDLAGSPKQDSIQSDVDSLLSSAANDTSVPDASNEPLVSPFIADAKVEKRPLGQAQPTGSSEPTDTEDPVVLAPIESTGDLPAELSNGLLAVESNELHDEEKPVEPAVQEVTSSDTQPEVKPPKPEEAPVQTSTPPQYKPEDTDKEPAEHSALYDEVSSAHVAKPAKKKNGWLVPVAIVGLVLLGCAGGIAVYYMMMG